MSRAITIGSQAPDFQYRRPDGAYGSLSELWKDGPLLVLWLRQCG